MSELITVDPGKIQALAQEGENFIFKPEAEQELLRLLEVQALVNDAVERVKEGIGEAGMSVNPNFKGVIGDKVRCTYRKYGKKYATDGTADKSFLYTKEYVNVDAKAVEAYVKEVGELPDGIRMPEREAKLSITVREE